MVLGVCRPLITFHLHLVKISTMKSLKYLTLFVILINLASCTGGADPEVEKQKQDSLLQAQQDSLLDLFRGELQAISNKVKEVSASNGIFNLDTAEGESLSKEDIMNQVEALSGLLSSNQKELNDLYKRMKNSKVKSDELEKMLKAMQDQVAERESQIKDLMNMLAEKDVQIGEILARVDSMRVTNIDLAEEVISMDETMNEVHYVVGDAKELKEKGITSKEGGLLGIGGTKKFDVSKLDPAHFTNADKRDLQIVPLYSKKAKLITNHPESSYEFVLDDDGQVESLRIQDSKSFWTATDYLVVEVTN